MALALPIATTTVAIPAFHQMGHNLASLPDHALVDARHHTLPFDIRRYPDVLAAVAGAGGKTQPVGIWTCDLIAYGRDDTPDLLAWIMRRFAHWSDAARRALFWREAKPLGIVERLIVQNVITDSGATAMLKVVNNIAATQFFNHLVLSADAKTAQLSAAMGSTGVTAIPVVAGGASFTNGMPAVLGFGTANTENVTIGAGSTGTSVVTSATTKTHSQNDWLVQAPTTSDNPSSVTSGYDSGALSAGAFTFSGTGAGNRQVQVAFNFPANAAAPGSGYTDIWSASAGAITANTTAAHLTRSPLLVNSTTGANITYTESL